jgi:hypothetical protein
MASSLLTVAARPVWAVREASAAAIARFLTEQESLRKRRAVPDSTMATILNAFQALMADQGIRERVVAAYRGKRKKAALLMEILT